MKHISIITLCLAAFLFISPAQAQESNESNGGRLAYEDGDISINAGMSLGLIGYGYGLYGNSSFAVPLVANVDIGISEYFSIGGFLGYLSRNYSGYAGPYNNSNYKYTFRSISFGVDGTFHASTLLNREFDFNINDKKVDYYARLMIGFETTSWNYNGYNNYYDDAYDSKGSRAIFAPVLGVRYMFTPNFGGFLEAGRGNYGYLSFGISVKF